jgi:hypothetical protein
VSDLEMLTFEALQTKIRDCRAAARNDAVKGGWDRLLGVIDPFLSQGQTTYDPVVGSRWSLTRVKVTGYQGISSTHPLQIDIKQTPGITIIHGANGSGKSSLSDAIETALRGTPPRYSDDAKGGNTPLWERLHCNSGTARGVSEQCRGVAGTVCPGRVGGVWGGAQGPRTHAVDSDGESRGNRAGHGCGTRHPERPTAAVGPWPRPKESVRRPCSGSVRPEA